MKSYSTIILILLCSLNLFGQTKYIYNYKQGYKFIRQAETNLNKDNLTKAERLIAKAKISSYGFCGNAWASAHSTIALIETQIFQKKKMYDEALSVLDSIDGCNFGGDCSARDSLKILTLYLKFGKEKVKQAFQNVNTVMTTEDTEFDHEYWVFLDDLKYRFWFRGPYPKYENGKKVEQEKSGNDFYDIAKDQSFFRLLE